MSSCFFVGLRKGLRDLLRGEGQALALRYMRDLLCGEGQALALRYMRDLLRGEGQALALRYCVICCVARDRPSPYVPVSFVAWRGTGPRPTFLGQVGAWCPPWAPRSTGDTRLRAR